MDDKTRREMLKIAAVGALPLAGCSGNGDGGSNQPTSSPTQRQATSTGGAQTRADARTETETTAERNQSASVQVGEVVSGDRMSMVVKSVSTTDSLGEFQNADAGNTYAVVRLEVKNTTQDEYANFSSFLQTQLKDGDGYTYTPTLSISDSAFQGGQLAPGEVARGDIAFEVPDGASGLTLQFDFTTYSFFQFDRVTVDLASEASSIGDLRQSLQVPIHGPGESVTHDGITVTVNSIGFTDSVGKFMQAPDGREYAVVDVTTANGTSEAVSFSSLLQMAMKDGTGRSFSYAAGATSQLTRAYSGGEVASGSEIRGKIAFEVPNGVSPLYFTFEYSVISGGSKTFWKAR